jgi:acyl-ACP thioesterase
MDMAQEIAYWAAEALGFGYESLHVHHTAWVLSRMHIHFLQPVRWHDTVNLLTWHKGNSGLFYLRDFLLRDDKGETSIAATSSWVVMDERTRRLVRPEVLQHLLQVEQTDHAIVEPAPKVILCEEMELVGEHIVTNTEIDINKHTNNARYVAWAIECLPFEESTRPIKDLCINFNKETKEEDCVQLYRLYSGDTCFVEGRVDGKSCFVVRIEY